MVPFFIARSAFLTPLHPLLGGSRASGTVPLGLFRGDRNGPFFYCSLRFLNPLHPLLGGSRASGTVPLGLFFKVITLSRQGLFQDKVGDVFKSDHPVI